MPTRRAKKCGVRANIQLDLITELNCVEWAPLIPGTGFATVQELSQAWALHGERILENVRRCMPGIRPSAMWHLGLLPLPEPKNKPRPDDTVQVWGTHKVLPAWIYFGCLSGEGKHFQGGRYWGEASYLHELGIVDDAEWKRAREWVDDRQYRPGWGPRQYEPLTKNENF
jgi:hypothetical protein